MLSEEAEVAYIVSSFHCKKNERGILYNDPDLNIDWRVRNPVVSKNDLKYKQFHEIERDFVFNN